MRGLVLKNFNRIFDFEFCSVSYWNIAIETNCFAICHEIFYNEEYRDPKLIDFNFDFDRIYFLLLKKFRHFSLFLNFFTFLKMY